MSVPHIARERWRANLEEFHAATMGFEPDRAVKTASVVLRRENADRMEHADGLRAAYLAACRRFDLAHAQAVVAWHEGGGEGPYPEKADHVDKGHPDFVAYKTAASDLLEYWRYWRALGELAGTTRPVLALDDFPEPSDAELAEMGY